MVRSPGLFALPSTVDGEKVDAGYDKGLLKITIGKRAEAKPKQIKVGNRQQDLAGITKIGICGDRQGMGRRWPSHSAFGYVESQV